MFLLQWCVGFFYGEAAMVIEKVLNNNVVVVRENDVEKIVMGRGLAFQKRAGDEFDEDLIDKTFILTNQKAANKFQQLVVDIPIEHIELAEEIISYAKLKTGKKLTDMIYISLVDHIYTSIVRFLDGITVKNALLWETRRFYPEQFAIGKMALDMIEERFKVRLPEDEAFALGALGDGMVIVPTEGRVYAPLDGTVTTLFPTLHAIGVTGDSGVEVLIHLGINTVNMNGKGFQAHIQQGDHVKKGQLIMEVDLKEIEKAGFSAQTPIIITNSDDMMDILKTDKKSVEHTDTLMTILF